MYYVYQFFLANPLKVGYSRFFLENSKYHKTKYSRLFYAFRMKRYFSSVKTLGLMTIYKGLWNLTIIGGVIKKYSYRLVPYLVAENANLKAREAIQLSRKLMNGYKWRSFLLDISFLGWELLNLITFGLLGVFFLNPYREGANAEFYKAIIVQAKKGVLAQRKMYKKVMDKGLYITEEKDYYPGAELVPPEYVYQHYSILSLGLMFFLFSAIGWVLEVLLFFFKTHTFVNRGVLLGPWLPIYGSGCVFILLVFVHGKMRKHLNNPILIFFLVMLLCGVLEYVSSFFLEVITGLKYWDYAGHFLNINGRVCLEGLIEFGIGGLLCVYFIAPKINHFFNKYPKKKLLTLFLLFLMLFALDGIRSSFYPNIGYGITEPINIK